MELSLLRIIMHNRFCPVCTHPFMPKQFFQSWLPSPEKVASMKFMRIFGKRSLNPVLWYINRKSISKAVFIGTFWGILPIPFHTALIVLTVLIMEVNLPVSILLAWLTNPLTLAPILLGAFWIGSQIYQVNMIDQDMLLGVLHQMTHWVTNMGQGHVDLSLAKILLSGLIVEALFFSVLFFLMTRLFWRFSIIRQWKKRTITADKSLDD